MTAIAPPIKQQITNQVKPTDPISPQPTTNLITDQWISATWDEFVKVLETPLYADSRCYYDKNQVRQMRIETMPVGSEHARDNGIIYFVIALYAH